MAVINIDERVTAGSLTIESIEEQQSRLRRAEADAAHKRWQSTILFLALLAASAIIFWICVGIALYNSDPEQKKFAWAILSAIVSGTVGFKLGSTKGGG